jgi:valyl-tRNA synthetase
MKKNITYNFFQNLLERFKEGNLDPKEILLAEKALRKDFPQGIPECGADSLRFSLCSYNYKGIIHHRVLLVCKYFSIYFTANFVNFDINHVIFHRRFCNKIWNAFRLYTQVFSGIEIPEGTVSGYGVRINFSILLDVAFKSISIVDWR